MTTWLGRQHVQGDLKNALVKGIIGNGFGVTMVGDRPVGPTPMEQEFYDIGRELSHRFLNLRQMTMHHDQLHDRYDALDWQADVPAQRPEEV